MNNNFNKAAEFPSEHFTITPHATAGIPQGPLAIYALTDGNISVADKNNTVVTYAVTAGDLLPVLAYRVISPATTATCIGLR